MRWQKIASEVQERALEDLSDKLSLTEALQKAERERAEYAEENMRLHDQVKDLKAEMERWESAEWSVRSTSAHVREEDTDSEDEASKRPVGSPADDVTWRRELAELKEQNEIHVAQLAAQKEQLEAQAALIQRLHKEADESDKQRRETHDTARALEETCGTPTQRSPAHTQSYAMPARAQVPAPTSAR